MTLRADGRMWCDRSSFPGTLRQDVGRYVIREMMHRNHKDVLRVQRNVRQMTGRGRALMLSISFRVNSIHVARPWVFTTEDRLDMQAMPEWCR